MNKDYIENEKLRKELTCSNNEFLSAKRGRFIRLKLRAYAEKHYKQKYTDSDYIEFLMRDEHVRIYLLGDQETNYPHYYKLFSVSSQHVYGDCVRELLDKAIDGEKETIAKQDYIQLNSSRKYIDSKGCLIHTGRC